MKLTKHFVMRLMTLYLQLVRWFFSYWPLKFDREPLWPQIDDHNHGAVSGLQYYPAYK